MNANSQSYTRYRLLLTTSTNGEVLWQIEELPVNEPEVDTPGEDSATETGEQPRLDGGLNPGRID